MYAKCKKCKHTRTDLEECLKKCRIGLEGAKFAKVDRIWYSLHNNPINKLLTLKVLNLYFVYENTTFFVKFRRFGRSQCLDSTLAWNHSCERIFGEQSRIVHFQELGSADGASKSTSTSCVR